MVRIAFLSIVCGFAALALAQDAQQAEPARGFKEKAGADAGKVADTGQYVVTEGTRIPLNLINSVSTRTSVVGDRIYLETAFPILANGRIVIPPGSYVAGTVTNVKRPGRVKGKGELHVRFDSLTLPNGVTRDFRARLSGVDGSGRETLDREEGKVQGDSNKGEDMRKVADATIIGSGVGAMAGGLGAGRGGMGAGIGAAAGAAAGLIGVLATRGPDAVLPRGSTIEMVLDRPLTFEEEEVSFDTSPRRPSITPAQQQQQSSGGLMRRFPVWD